MNEIEELCRQVVNFIPDNAPSSSTELNRPSFAAKTTLLFAADEIARLTAENAELRERLEKAVILPCKADDTVWCIRAYNNGKGYQIEENSVMEIVFEYGNNMKIKTSLGLFGYDKWTYGLDCFTDRAKAEARLAELKGGDKQ